jgi:hypothetical protein
MQLSLIATGFVVMLYGGRSHADPPRSCASA